MGMKGKDLCIAHECQPETAHRRWDTINTQEDKMFWPFDVSQPLSETTQYWYNEHTSQLVTEVEMKVINMPNDSHLPRLI